MVYWCHRSEFEFISSNITHTHTCWLCPTYSLPPIASLLIHIPPTLTIAQANYHFHTDYWGNISAEVQDFIRKMLTLDQKLRWSARQLLSHPWITAGDDELASRDITGSLSELKRYNARRRLRAAANTVIMTNRMARLTNFGSKMGSELGDPSPRATDSTDAAGTASTNNKDNHAETTSGDSSYKPPSIVS